MEENNRMIGGIKVGGLTLIHLPTRMSDRLLNGDLTKIIRPNIQLGYEAFLCKAVARTF
jgi:hypothetical protein